jgi:hypothetical protein
MSFKMKTESTGVDRIPVPQGLQHGILVDMIDHGTQKGEYEGKPYARREVRLGFVFPEHTQVFNEENGEQPAMLSVWRTLSLDPKSNLHRDAMAMIGKSLPEEYDISELLGINVMATVAHVEKDDKSVRDKIASFSPLYGKLEPIIIADKDLRILNLDSFDKEVFESLGEKEQEIIKLSPEYVPY